MSIYFLDFEASSLDSGSFPIEIAWINESGQGECYLIKPESTWTDWSTESEGIHGISRQTLAAEGTGAVVVARRVLTAFRGDCLLIASNPDFDGYWLSMLLKVVNGPELAVLDLHSLIGEEIRRLKALITVPVGSATYPREARFVLNAGQTMAASIQDTMTLGQKTQHRALPDAQHLWQIWSAVKAAIDAKLVNRRIS